MSRHRTSTRRLVAAAVAVVILARLDVAQSADPDPRPGPGPIIIDPGPPLPGSGRVVDLAELPIATAILEVAADELEDIVLEGAIIDGQGFMINDCLGVRATYGKFFLHMSRPEFYLGSCDWGCVFEAGGAPLSCDAPPACGHSATRPSHEVVSQPRKGAPGSTPQARGPGGAGGLPPRKR